MNYFPTKQLILLIYAVFMTVQSLSQSVIVNEVMASNNTSISDEAGEYEDWIELYNPTGNPIDLGGFYMSDDPSEFILWQIPTTDPLKTTVPANGYLILWADKDDDQGANHVGFKLGAGGESIFIVAPDGVTLLNEFTYPALLADQSYGRINDGDATFATFANPSPAMTNNGSLSALDRPEFMPESGKYSSPQMLVLTPPSPSTSIYYTTDGSIPTSNSNLYTGPITIDTSVSIRAIASQPGFLDSEIVTETYIFHDTSLPIISLTTDPYNLYDDTDGIYTVGTNGIISGSLGLPANFNQDWERPMHVVMIESDGTLAFQTDAGVELNGNYSRIYPQKSLKLKAKSEYGETHFKHQVFPGYAQDEYKRLILANGGSNFESLGLRDALNQTLTIGEVDIDQQRARPTTVFINGQYWGIMYIRDAKNKHFFDENHNIKDIDKLDILKPSEVSNYADELLGFNDDYRALFSFVESNDLSISGNYSFASSKIDVSEFINYQIAQIFVHNTDWPGNNVRIWKEQHEEGKFRWVLFDTDFGMGASRNYTDGRSTNYDFDALSYATDILPVEEGNNTYYATMFFRKLLENEAFRNEYIQRSATQLNTLFETSRMQGILTDMYAEIYDELPAHFDRWQGTVADLTDDVIQGMTPALWQSEVDYIIDEWMIQRPTFMRQHIENYFSLGGRFELTIPLNDSSDGRVVLNENQYPAPYNYTGTYFDDIPMPIKAIPNPGYRFSHWLETGNTDPVEIINTNVNTTRTPIFIAEADLVINEIYYNPNTDGDDEFLELYNPSNYSKEISGYRFSEGFTFTFPAATIIPANGYILLTNNADIYEATTHSFQVFQIEQGGLSNGGELIVFQNVLGHTIDEVEYDDKNPWNEEADGDGYSLALINPSSDNTVATNWDIQNPSQLTPGLANFLNVGFDCPLVNADTNDVCDDGDDCTINDTYDAACNCIGTFEDTDGDGICDAEDTSVGDCIVGAICSDGDSCTVNDIYDSFCNCIGTFQDVDNDGICDTDGTICNGIQYPFNCNTVTIPGIVQAEEYDEGGEGIAYHDNAIRDGNLTYRPDEFVDATTTIVGWTKNEEWLEFTVDVEEGIYLMQLHSTSNSDIPGSVDVSIDGDFLSNINVETTGGWGTTDYQDFTSSNVYISGGNAKVLRLEIIKGSFNIDYIEFLQVAPSCAAGIACNDNDPCTIDDVFDEDCNCIGTYVDTDNDGICDGEELNCTGIQRPYLCEIHMVPGIIPAEHFDDGGEGISYHDDITRNGDPDFRSNTSVDVTPGIVGWIENNEWLEYTVSITPGEYNISIIAASNSDDPGSINISLDDVLLTNINIENTGGWGSSSNEKFTLNNITIPGGPSAVLRLDMIEGGFNLDQIEFELVVADCLVGGVCDDSDPCTINDTYDVNCGCVGIYQDSDMDGICDANDNTDGDCALADSCDDGDACTINDVYDAACNCTGTFQDTDGDGICDAEELMCTVGDPCDDMNACTIDDVFAANCNCVGTIQDTDMDGICDADDLTNGDCILGDPCDDLDACTIDDVYDANCNCIGTFQDSDGDGICDADDLTNGNCVFAEACDDDNACTINDAFDANCNCVGTFQDTDGDGICDADDLTNGDCVFAEACDDDNACTINDAFDANCNCVGTFQDTDGDGICDADDLTNGNCVFAEACDDDNACTINDAFDANCNCVGTFQDTDGDGICDADDLTNGNCVFAEACDDDNACTINDAFDANCNCVGTFQDTDGDGICDAEEMACTGGQYPYNCNLVSIPGMVQAEEFDEGGQGVAYSDDGTRNGDLAYRPNELVDATTSIVGWINDDEWLEYTLDVSTGTYTIEFMVASNSSNPGNINVSMDGVFLGNVDIQNTGGWGSSNYASFSLSNIVLAGGSDRVLRLDIPEGSFNLDKMNFILETTSCAGAVCDDGDVCTTNDVLDANCDCAGTFQDSDNDGVCNAQDVCEGYDDAIYGGNCPSYNLDNFTACTILTINEIPDDLSGLTYRASSNSLFGITNGDPKIYELNLSGELIRIIDLDGFDDTEAIVHIDGNTFAVAEEKLRRIVFITIADGLNIADIDHPGSAASIQLNVPGTGNDGIEGLAYDKINDVLYAVKERTSMAVYRIPNASNILGSTVTPQEAFDINALAATYPNTFTDLAGLQFTNQGTLLMLSQEGEMLVEVNPTNGMLLSSLDISPINPTRIEGVTILNNDNMYLVGEPNEFFHAVRTGATCNDNDVCTINDVYDANCNCAGTFQDSDGDGTCDAEEGNCTVGGTCNDNDVCTINDVYDANCNCAGTFQDSDGDGTCDAEEGNCTVGSTCNDNDVCTINDVYDANCNCAGTFQDSDGDGTCDAEEMDCSGGQYPYNCTMVTIPGMVQAEEFDEGGQGVAYNDDGTRNGDLAYRPNELVDATTSTVGWIKNGEWLEYTLNVTPGTYNIEFLVASNSSNPGSMDLSMNGIALGNIDVQNTGGWGSSNYSTRSISSINLAGGESVFRIDMVGGSFNLDKFTFISQPLECTPGNTCNDGDACTINDIFDVNCNCIGTFQDSDGDGICDADETEIDCTSGQYPYNCNMATIPGMIQAEEFDEGGQGVAYSDDNIRQGDSNYRPGVTVDATTKIIGWIEDQEWLEYTVDVTAGTYTIEIIAATNANAPGSINLSLDGVFLANIDIENTGGWGTSSNQTVAVSGINLAGGSGQVLRLDMVEGSFNLDKMNFIQTGSITTSCQGDVCNDGDACTINDVMDATCNCAGTFQDADGDGICDNDDLCPFDASNNCNSISYCALTSTNSNLEYIQGVQFGTINNISGNDNGYGDYTDLSTSVTLGQTLPITLTPGFSNNTQPLSEAFKVWIDYNRDGDFEDSNEVVFVGTSNTSISGTIVIPSNATLGATRMRISMKWASAVDTPCGTFNYGEAEDYTILLTGQSLILNRYIESTEDTVPNMLLYPNPMKNQLHIQLDKAVSNGMLEIYDNMGQAVYAEVLEAGTRTIDLQLSGQSAGMYFAKLQLANGTFVTERFIKLD